MRQLGVKYREIDEMLDVIKEGEMATSSLYRNFIIEDEDALNQLAESLNNPKKIDFIKKDEEKDEREGLEWLKQFRYQHKS